MEAAIQLSQQPLVQSIRNSIGRIEAIELSTIGFVLWGLFAMIPTDTPDLSIISLFIALVMIEGAVLGSWLIYNGYIRLARGGRGGQIRNLRVLISLGFLTSGYTIITWTILDLNRWIISKIFYRGEAPVEYAWSTRSKQVRKLWEQTLKARK